MNMPGMGGVEKRDGVNGRTIWQSTHAIKIIIPSFKYCKCYVKYTDSI